jgi:putative acetyltransferase
MNSNIHIIRTNSQNQDFINLVALLDDDLKIRDGEEHLFFAQYNKIDLIKNVVIAYKNGRAIGCGAFKKFDNETAEVKRMFTEIENRGQGIAQQVLAELEYWAAELGYLNCILETGKKQPEAIRLYTKSGYSVIPNYGQYKNVANSICMIKSLN